VSPAGRIPLAGPEEVVVAVDQRRRQRAVLEQLLRAIEVAEHGVEQARALGDRAGELLPLGRRQDQGQRIDLPRPVGALRIGIDVVGDAVLEDAPAHVIDAVPHLLGRRRVEVGQERLPRGANAAVLGEHLVEAVGLLQVVGQQGRWHQGHGRWSSILRRAVAGDRCKSNVNRKPKLAGAGRRGVPPDSDERGGTPPSTRPSAAAMLRAFRTPPATARSRLRCGG
jgi:hypothetical protein